MTIFLIGTIVGAGIGGLVTIAILLVMAIKEERDKRNVQEINQEWCVSACV